MKRDRPSRTRRRPRRRYKNPAAGALPDGFGLGFITGLFIGSGLAGALGLETTGKKRKPGKVLEFRRPSISDSV